MLNLVMRRGEKMNPKRSEVDHTWCHLATTILGNFFSSSKKLLFSTDTPVTPVLIFGFTGKSEPLIF